MSDHDRAGRDLQRPAQIRGTLFSVTSWSFSAQAFRACQART